MRRSDSFDRITEIGRKARSQTSKRNEGITIRWTQQISEASAIDEAGVGILDEDEEEDDVCDKVAGVKRDGWVDGLLFCLVNGDRRMKRRW